MPEVPPADGLARALGTGWWKCRWAVRQWAWFSDRRCLVVAGAQRWAWLGGGRGLGGGRLSGGYSQRGACLAVDGATVVGVAQRWGCLWWVVLSVVGVAR